MVDKYKFMKERIRTSSFHYKSQHLQEKENYQTLTNLNLCAYDKSEETFSAHKRRYI